MQPLSYSARLRGFDLALQVVRLNPLFGVGVHLEAVGISYQWVIHNTFLYALASFGVPAVVLLVWTITVPIYRTIIIAWRAVFVSDRVDAVLWIAAMVGILIQMSMFSGMTSKYFWMLLGLMTGESLASMARLKAAHGVQPTDYSSRQQVAEAVTS
jgi:O-antigen ligase